MKEIHTDDHHSVNGTVLGNAQRNNTYEKINKTKKQQKKIKLKNSNYTLHIHNGRLASHHFD